MDKEAIDRMIEVSCRQFREAMEDQRGKILEGIHEAARRAQEKKKDKIRYGLSVGIGINVNEGEIGLRLSHGLKHVVEFADEWTEPHPELPGISDE